MLALSSTGDGLLLAGLLAVATASVTTGTVAIPGMANRVGAMVAYLTPKRLLVPMLASRHPGLRD